MISVCIATYNGEKSIEKQIRSILKQLSPEDELIISDDGSTDYTISIINNLKDNRIKIYDGAHRHSPIWNFENALKHAKGEYIFLSDQDDEWMDNKIKVCMNYLKDHCCIVSDNITVNQQQQVITESFYSINHTNSNKIYNLLIKNGYLGCCMAFHRQILEKAIPFPQNIPMHDIWLGNVAAFYYDVKFIPEKLIHYYRHDRNASPTAGKSCYNMLMRLKFRLNVIKGLVHILSKKQYGTNAKSIYHNCYI
jgi:glycosyltransferase involved in cell wall biosynthesis